MSDLEVRLRLARRRQIVKAVGFVTSLGGVAAALVVYTRDLPPWGAMLVTFGAYMCGLVAGMFRMMERP